MRITIISVFPHVHESFLQTSLIARAIARGSLQVNKVAFADFCSPKERIDEPTCGPGAGMILKPEVVQRALEHVYAQWGKGYTVFFSPKGIVLNQQVAQHLVHQLGIGEQHLMAETPTSKEAHLILVCARYEGMDARVEEHYADLLLSIGDYVLMGGDVAAQVFLEVVLRLVPGIVGDERSVTCDSFSGALLDYPEYGLPVSWQNKDVPEIVRSGNHGAINTWRAEQARKQTVLQRFDWYRSFPLPPEERAKALTLIPDHYVILLFSHVKNKDSAEGNNSIASMDIHDAARACVTYGVKKLFIVSALADQRAILDTFMKFWRSSEGKAYNQSRYESVQTVHPVWSYTEALDEIAKLHNNEKPCTIVTSARQYEHTTPLDFTNQATVWRKQKPVALVFGTGHGIADRIIMEADYLLTPINGLTNYNHLSVRSAIAIVLDRWLGMQEKLDHA